jgi:AraC family transcriptional activator of pobA
MATRYSRHSGSRGIAAAPVPAFFLYGEPLQAPDERLVHVETIAARSHLHDWNIRPHRHRDLHQVLIAERGRMVAQVDDAAEALRAPAVVVIPPGIVHAFRFQPGAVGIVVSFASGLIPDLDGALDGLAAFLDHAMLRALDAASVRATDLSTLARMLLREFSRSAPGRPAALRGLLAALLANVLRLAHTPDGLKSNPDTPSRELVARFRRQIEEHYRNHLTVEAHAARLSVSTQRLRRACLTAAGQSPGELIHLRILIEAERQLRYTTMSVSQIAYHLGFDDPAYFCRFFASRMQVSPREFRDRDCATFAAGRNGASA